MATLSDPKRKLLPEAVRPTATVLLEGLAKRILLENPKLIYALISFSNSIHFAKKIFMCISFTTMQISLSDD